MRIGPYPRISLKAARDIRGEQKRLLYDDGINPCDAKKRSKDQRWGKHAQLTFEAVALDWHVIKTAGTWTERHSDDVLKKLNKDIFPAIGGMAIDAITAQDCLNAPPPQNAPTATDGPSPGRPLLLLVRDQRLSAGSLIAAWILCSIHASRSS